MNDREYLSIGEVLAQLLEEFPDVTISKIRFLESQGLIEPERTPSGYRKFTESEVERLRFILREQRTNYLPLRIIKDRLEDESSDISRDISIDPDTVSVSGHPAARGIIPRPAMSGAPVNSGSTNRDQTESMVLVPQAMDSHDALEDEPLVRQANARAMHREAMRHADKTESIPRDQLIQQIHIDPDFLRSLEAAGLVNGHDVGDTTFFDPHSAAIARTAARFEELGVDVRHLRAWKSSADRELSLFEQRILPLLRQRNPAAREQALDMLSEFVELGSELRSALLAREMLRLTEQR